MSGVPHAAAAAAASTAAVTVSAEPVNVTFEQMVVSGWDARVASVATFCVIGGLGAILNVIPPALTLSTQLRKNEVNIMIMNLSMAELMLCLSFLFGQTFYILYHEDLPPEGCHFLSFFHFTMAFASFIFPPCLAINRYISLYYSHIYRKIYTKRNVWLITAGGWAFCFVIPFIFMMAQKTGYDEDNHHCCMVLHGDTTWTVLYWLVIITPLLVFCDGTLIFCNYQIYRKLNGHASDQQLDKNVIRKNKEVLYFLIADMMFPICFHSMYHIFKFILVRRTNDFIKRFFISLYLFNSFMRGSVTLIMLRPYRVALRNACCPARVQIAPVDNSDKPTNENVTANKATEKTPIRSIAVKRTVSKPSLDL